jgi:chemotaxis protein CheC
MVTFGTDTLVAEDDLDVLTEVITIGVGRAAAAFSDLVGTRVELTVPTVRWGRSALESSALSGQQPSGAVISQCFAGEVAGEASLVFPPEGALVLGRLILGNDETLSDLDVEVGGVLLEIGNIVLNGVMGSLANCIAGSLTYSIPELSVTDNGLLRLDPVQMLIADVEFCVSDRKISGSFVIMFTWGSVHTVVHRSRMAMSV